MKSFARWIPRYHTSLTIVVLSLLMGGGLLHLASVDELAHLTWAAANVIVLGPLVWSVLRALFAGRVGVDVIALLAIAGALATGEYLAGAVIALMLAGGNALEEYAQGRAGRELRALVERAPREAHVRRGEQIVEVGADQVQRGDIVVVRSGEVVPVDGYVSAGTAIVDTSALTGEPLPVEVEGRGRVMSGSSNSGDPFELTALQVARDSMYASIVRLVEQATARKAPMVRMADRYSVVFLVATLVMAGGAWIVSGDPIRALAVLVIATPCPLILAPPIALVGGTSAAARQGVIVKGGAAIEALGRAGILLIDKTGTLTLGAPAVAEISSEGAVTPAELLRLAGSLEQMSVHSLAEAIAHAARSEHGELPIPTMVDESPGRGIAGMVDGRRIQVGSAGYLGMLGISSPETTMATVSGAAYAHVAIDGKYAGAIRLADTVREDAHQLAGMLHSARISRVVMATGDHAAAAHHVAEQLGIEEVHADCSAEDKLALLQQLRSRADGMSVVMVGDGINDAPALAAADVGIAMGSAGATVASEAAEAVVISNRIGVVADAIAIGRRSTRIARQSIIAGIALSSVGMMVAAAGYLPPIYGALAQEVIDLAVIVNAMRALAYTPLTAIPQVREPVDVGGR